ncbi:3,4-dihydroxy-2-butanone-4-phosphate synthase [Streptomyces sp. NPDC055140]
MSSVTARGGQVLHPAVPLPDRRKPSARKSSLRDGHLDRIRESVGRVSRTVDELLAGRVVVIADEASGAGFLAFAASRATPVNVAWAVHHGSGRLRAAMSPQRARMLALAPASATARAQRRRPHFPVSLDAASGTSDTGSAGGIARTLTLLADPAFTADDFTRPGHVAADYAEPGGVLTHPRADEAVLDLLSIAGLPLVGVVRALAGGEGIRAFCEARGTALIGIQDVTAFRELTEPLAVDSHTWPR